MLSKLRLMYSTADGLEDGEKPKFHIPMVLYRMHEILQPVICNEGDGWRVRKTYLMKNILYVQ